MPSFGATARRYGARGDPREYSRARRALAAGQRLRARAALGLIFLEIDDWLAQPFTSCIYSPFLIETEIDLQIVALCTVQFSMEVNFLSHSIQRIVELGG